MLVHGSVLSVQVYTSIVDAIVDAIVDDATLEQIQSPAVYKPADVILEDIKDTVDVVGVVRPVYNFKNG